MKYLRKALEAEKQGKTSVALGFIGDTPYTHTETLDENGEVSSSTTTFFLEWSWTVMGPDFELNPGDEQL